MIDLNGRSAALYGLGIAVATAGVGLAIFGDDRIASVGLALVQLAAVLGVAGYFGGKRATLDDAYEMGYQAGFRRGERVKPKVIRMTDRGQSA